MLCSPALVYFASVAPSLGGGGQVAVDPTLATVFGHLLGPNLNVELLPGTARDLLPDAARELDGSKGGSKGESGIGEGSGERGAGLWTFEALAAAVRARHPGCVLVGLRATHGAPGSRTELCPPPGRVAGPVDRLVVIRLQ